MADDDQTGHDRMTERPVLPKKPDNTGGGKEPWFRNNAESDEQLEIGQPKNVAPFQGERHRFAIPMVCML